MKIRVKITKKKTLETHRYKMNVMLILVQDY